MLYVSISYAVNKQQIESLCGMGECEGQRDIEANNVTYLGEPLCRSHPCFLFFQQKIFNTQTSSKPYNNFTKKYYYLLITKENQTKYEEHKPRGLEVCIGGNDALGFLKGGVRWWCSC